MRLQGLVLRILLLGCLAMLSACATNLQELRQVTPRGTPYNIALTQKYLKFSEQEAAAYDWVDSSYFAEKGLMAGYGQEVFADQIAEWNIPEDLKPELVAARQKLEAVITKAVQQSHPEKAAEAVFNYDCWLEELEENPQSSDATLCQVKFYNAIDDIEFAMLTPPETEGQTALEAAISNTAYLVYFGFDRAKFDEAAAQVVNQVLRDVKENQPEEVIIHGHTDTSGSEEYNLKLSEERALSVLEALIKGGIPKAILTYFAFGESDPAVKTDDGVKEPKNRRVEIFIG